MEFYPARPSRVAIRLAYLALPIALRAICGVARVVVSEGDLEKLRQAATHASIIAPNHPSRVEPMIVAELARRLDSAFFYVSARENFEEFGGRILQRLGAYSIARGLPDRASLAATRSILAEKDRPVVLFPEGEVYHHNDLMLPLNSGVAQIGFWVMGDMAKLGKTPRLPIVPIAVKYRFIRDAKAYTERRIGRLEDAVGISGGSANWHARVHAIGGRIVTTLESRYKLSPSGDLTERIEKLKLCIIERGFSALGLAPKAGSLPEQMRALHNAVRELQTEEAASDYERKIVSQRLRQAEPILDDLRRMEDSILTSGHYVSDHPTYERLSELLGRMEDETFGRHARYLLREAIVKISDPVPLEDYAADYAKDKRQAVAKSTEEVARRIAGMLESLADEGTPIPSDLWPREADPAATGEVDQSQANVGV